VGGINLRGGRGERENKKREANDREGKKRSVLIAPRLFCGRIKTFALAADPADSPPSPPRVIRVTIAIPGFPRACNEVSPVANPMKIHPRGVRTIDMRGI